MSNTKSRLTYDQKALVAKSYLAGNTQSALAELYGVHRKTIQNALVEHGVIPPMGMGQKLKRQGYRLFTEDQQKILEFCKQYKVDSAQLEALINIKPLTENTMLNTFTSMSDAEKLNFLRASRALQRKWEGQRAQAS